MLWGVVLASMAACTSYAGLMITRVLLGIFEAPVAPILVLIIAMWYKKEEQGRRVSYFYVCNSITQIFGGGVAYGASFSKTGFASWRIFFLIIGLMTILLGFLVFMFLPDSPVKAVRFTDAEKIAALLRVKENQSGTQNATLKKAQVIESLKDVRVWLVFLSVLLTSIPNGMWTCPCLQISREARPCCVVTLGLLLTLDKQAASQTSPRSCLPRLATAANRLLS